jgi:cyclopropane fatty-acyl-phospholipid synthase-like methyltransferase
VARERFEAMYEGRPPWDVGRPQAEFVRLAESGAIAGSVLDAGCGTGENALYLASRGHEVWGVDFVPAAIERAQAKAAERGLAVHFEVGDALLLPLLGRRFDTVIDCGLFHVFGDEHRRTYAEGVAAVLRPGGRLFLMCFSEHEPGTHGPRRVTQAEIRDAFASGWEVESIGEARFEALPTPDLSFSEGGARAWLATL